MKQIYSLKIFYGLQKEVVDEIISRSIINDYYLGDKILTEGQESNGNAYIIKSGEVMVKIGGKEVATLGVGDIFGEIALLNDEERTATIEAKTQVSVMIISKETLFLMIEEGNETINRDIISRIEDNLNNL